MQNNVARIKNASLYNHWRSRMSQNIPHGLVEVFQDKQMNSLILRGDWCPGPELNRHARSLVTQDFKSCELNPQAFEIIEFTPESTLINASKTHQSMLKHAPNCAVFHDFTFRFQSPIQHVIRGEHGDISSKVYQHKWRCRAHLS